MIDFWFLVTTDAGESYIRFLRWPILPKVGEKFVSETGNATVHVEGVTHVLTNTGQSRILVFGHCPGGEGAVDVLVNEMGFRHDPKDEAWALA